MAGAGSKLFTDGSVLNAAQVNTYLMDQSIMRFATTTARDAAFGGAGEPVLAEGMTCYIDADNSIYTYDGSAWVKMVSASQPAGIQLTKTQTFTGQSQVNVDSCFSSEFANYLVTLNITSVSGNTGIFVRMRNAGTTNANNEYVWGGFIAYTGSSILTQINSGGATSDWKIADQDTVYNPNLPIKFDMMAPQLSLRTGIFSQGFTPVNPLPYYRQIGGTMTVTTSYDSFSLLTNSGSFTMDGTVRVYGYRNS